MNRLMVVAFQESSESQDLANTPALRLNAPHRPLKLTSRYPFWSTYSQICLTTFTVSMWSLRWAKKMKPEWRKFTSCRKKDKICLWSSATELKAAHSTENSLLIEPSRVATTLRSLTSETDVCLKMCLRAWWNLTTEEATWLLCFRNEERKGGKCSMWR